LIAIIQSSKVRQFKRKDGTSTKGAGDGEFTTVPADDFFADVKFKS
jgi:hypothetical protein